MKKSSIKPHFSLQSYRNTKQFTGELTAALAKNEIALRETLERLNSEQDGWEELGIKHSIKVDGMDETLMLGMSRLHIVSLYSGWDSFCSELRCEYQKLFSKDWNHTDEKTPFENIYFNCSSSSDLRNKIGEPREKTMEYYRKVRNAVVHPAKDTVQKMWSHYDDLGNNREKVRDIYEMSSPPNKPDDLSFYDIKLFARLVLDVSALISEAFDPGDERLSQLIPLQKWQNPQCKQKRFENCIIGYLETEYALNEERAMRVLSLIQKSG